MVDTLTGFNAVFITLSTLFYNAQLKLLIGMKKKIHILNTYTRMHNHNKYPRLFFFQMHFTKTVSLTGNVFVKKY